MNGTAVGCEDAFHISHRDSCYLYVAFDLKSTLPPALLFVHLPQRDVRSPFGRAVSNVSCCLIFLCDEVVCFGYH